MKRFFMFLFVLFGCSHPIEYGTIWDYLDFDETIEPIKVEYYQWYLEGNAYESENLRLIHSLLHAISNLEIVDETDIVATDYDDILVFEMEDGTRYSIGFNATNLEVKDDLNRIHYYVVDGFEELTPLFKRFENEKIDF